MEKKHRAALTKNRVFILENLVIEDTFLSHCYADNVLQDFHAELIKAKSTNSAMVAEFLAILPKRGPKAMKVFLTALCEVGSEHVADKLDPDLSQQIQSQTHEDSSESVPTQMQDTTEAPLTPAVQVSGASGSEGASADASPLAGANMGVGTTSPDDEINLDDEELPMIDPEVTDIDPNDSTISQLLKDKQVYQLNRTKTRRALIINNEEFTCQTPQLQSREGSEFDSINLKSLLEALGFNVTVKDNLSAQRMIEVLDAERSNTEHKDADSFILAILSHGNKGKVYGADGYTVKVKTIKTCFDGKNCPALHGKPKLFIIQACRGNLATQGVIQSDAEEEVDPTLAALTQAIDNMQLDQGDTPGTDAFSVTTAGHERGDMLVACSTVEGYKSWREESRGSWFIRALVKVFMCYAHKEHVADMLTIVRDVVGRKQSSYKSGLNVQMTHDDNTLRKKWYLFPGLHKHST